MQRINAPASSANLGPGFDCLGIAFDIYNVFDVELSDHLILENCEERFNNEDNLFYVAYKKGCEALGVNDSIHAVFHCDVPVSRGLGSSASMIMGGLKAASVLHEDRLSDDEIFQIASEMEGHPDNVAPCLFGGLMASIKDSSGQYITTALHIHESYHFYALIPDFEVRTDEARAILPDSYSKAVTVSNSAKAIMLCQSIQNGDIALLKEAGNDMIHEPYRRKLIHGYDQVRAMMEEKTGGVFLISGSGSTCLLITHNILDDLNDLYIDGHTWQIREIRPAMKGTYAER